MAKNAYLLTIGLLGAMVGLSACGASAPTTYSAETPGIAGGRGTKQWSETLARADHTFKRVDRSASKGALWGDIQPIVDAALYSGAQVPPQPLEPSAQIWVVAVSGDSRPREAAGLREDPADVYRWRVIVYEVKTGSEVLAFGLSDGRSWPAWFDGLRDQDTGTWRTTGDPAGSRQGGP